MNIRVRFAPSPTGPLHIGSIRTALYNYLFAKKFKGVFVLRIEDTDKKRFIPASIPYIFKSLKWLGIEPDEGLCYGGVYSPYQQSKRIHIYVKFIQLLLYYGYAYYAFDSKLDLIKYRKDNNFIYNTSSRRVLHNSINLSSKEVITNIKNNVPYVVRFKIPEHRLIKFHDLIKGDIMINTNVLEDKILMKSDGLFTYHFVNVIDDFLMKITHVIRGEEWISSTPLHILIYEAFNWPIPNFMHLPLIISYDGKGKLSKRKVDVYNFPIFPLSWHDNNKGIIYKGFKESGYLPESLLNYLFILGTKNVNRGNEILSLAEMQKQFHVKNINHASVKFNIDKLKWFNKKYLQCYDIENISFILHKELLSRGICDYNHTYVYHIVELIKYRVVLITDIWLEAKYFFIPPVSYSIVKYDNIVLGIVINHLSKIVLPLIEGIILFTSHNLQYLIYNNIKRVNIKLITQNLRFAIVGSLYGVSLFKIIETIGRNKTIHRIKLYVKYLQNL
jgi:glutamyl-tRNA synthetase